MTRPRIPSDLDDLLEAPIMLSDPFPAYIRLRNEAPVAWSERWQAWVVSRYGDVQISLKDKENLSNENRQALLFDDLMDEQREDLKTLRHYFAQRDVIGSDPPDHTRMRGLVQKAFTPRMIASLEPRIATLAEELIAEAAHETEFDFVRDVAHPVPVVLIAELLGAPAVDRPLFKKWSADILAFQGSGRTRYDTAMVSQASLSAMFAYMADLIATRRREPRDDLITALAVAEEDGRRLDRDELLATCNTILTAGHETTTNLIGNLVRELLRNPDAWAAIREDRSRIPAAVQESLRLDAPKQRNFRRIKRTHELSGITLPEGQMVFQLIGSANRDPDIFPDPDRFDMDRGNVGAHLSFGSGIHFCLGAPLARAEARIILEKLLDRMPNATLADQPLTWQRRVQFRGPAELWIRP